jgi:hypothetical protein
MHFSYDAEFGAYTPEAYERLLLEAMVGDATLFIRRDEVEDSLANRRQHSRGLVRSTAFEPGVLFRRDLGSGCCG